jgi:ankyrin repeat protein
LQTVAVLIEKGASVNAVTTDSETPLHWASKLRFNVETVALLIEKGASVNAVTNDNKIRYIAHLDLGICKQSNY